MLASAIVIIGMFVLVLYAAAYAGAILLVAEMLIPGFVIGSFGVSAFLIDVVDPAELDLPYAGRVRFTGMENEGIALIGNVDRVRADYARLHAEHRAALADTTRRLGWRMTLHRTDHSPEQALLPAYMALGVS